MEEKIPLILLLTGATIVSFIWLLFNRKRINASWWEVLILALLHTIIGVGCVIFFAFIESGFDINTFGSLSLFGGVFLMPVFYLLYAKIKKISFGDVFDVFVISLITTLMFARINCIITGCCLGKNINYTEARYPTRELEIGFYVVLTVVFIIFTFKKILTGKLYLIYLISYGTFRFIIEFLRESKSESVFHVAHVWSLLSIGIGIGLLVYLSKRKKDVKK